MEAIDTLIQDRHLEMIKAAIPYLDNSRQKNMAMQRTMALFQNPGNDLKMCSEEEKEDPVQMLSAIREYCTDKEKEMIDNMINLVQMFSTYGTLFSAT